MFLLFTAIFIAPNHVKVLGLYLNDPLVDGLHQTTPVLFTYALVLFCYVFLSPVCKLKD